MQDVGENESMEDFSKRVQSLMAKELGVTATNHTSLDKVEYAKRTLIGSQAQGRFPAEFCIQVYCTVFVKMKVMLLNQLRSTVNSRKSQTLFINYDFRWLMVAGIF